MGGFGNVASVVTALLASLAKPRHGHGGTEGAHPVVLPHCFRLQVRFLLAHYSAFAVDPLNMSQFLKKNNEPNDCTIVTMFRHSVLCPITIRWITSFAISD